MKIAVGSNSTPWTDKSIQKLVQAAVRHGNRKQMPSACLVDACEGDDATPKACYDGARLVLQIPEATPLRQIANASRRRDQLDSTIALVLIGKIARSLPGISAWPTAGEDIPPVVARAKPRARPKFEDTPIGRAQAKVARVEVRVKKFQSLLDRAKRDLRKAQGVLKRMETKYAPKRYGPRL